MNRVDRLTAILMLLQDRPRTSEEIARHFEVSKRTILRDVQALSEMGVPLIAREGAGGGYSLPEDYWLAPLPLTSREAFLLLLALSAVSRHSEIPFTEAYRSLIAKLRALMPSALPDVDALLAVVEVDVPDRDQRAPFLDALIEAAQTMHWVRVIYESTERRSTQHLFPLSARAEGGLWYCRAYSMERGEERTYRVDRILDLTEPAPGFLAFQPPMARPYSDKSYPQVIAHLTPKGVGMVEREQHLGVQIERNPDGSGSLTLRCPPSELDWYARYFASLGAEVEVTAPESLREKMRELGAALAKRYQDTG
jgi:predicted DNA-binding transcriptional regulator YafY